MLNYLKNDAEEMPSWLKRENIKTIPLTKAFKSRVVYYPGSGYDIFPITTFTSHNNAHVFLYTDYIAEEAGYIPYLKLHGVPGYKIISDYDIEINQDILLDYQKDVDARHKSGKPKCRFDENQKVICHGFIFEKIDKNSKGADRFVVIYAAMDGFYLYRRFKNMNLYALMIKDHGFGGNYDLFGRDGLLEKIAIENNFFPKHILCRYDRTNAYQINHWHNYDKDNAEYVLEDPTGEYFALYSKND